MDSIFTRIGEHLFSITVDDMKLFNWISTNFAVLQNFEVASPERHIWIKSGFGSSFVDYDVKILKTRTTLIFSRADYEIHVNSDYTHATVLVHDELSLKHALLNLYSSFIVNQNWGLLLHSSSSIVAGKAHLLTGQSGFGISTSARFSESRDLLSDEASLIKISPQEICVFNSPFRSEIKPTDFEGNYSLDSIHMLHPAMEIRRNLIKKSDALLNLLDKVFYWAHSNKETRQVMRMLSMLVDQVPVYDLEFQKSPLTWEMIS
jgi:hypothetical protein